MNGVIVVDKPGGMTSARVVGQVKRALNVKKIGHTGTLDPMATGVLPLCIGEGTKIAGYLLAEDKSYEGEFVLGICTDTLDKEGSVTAENPEAAKLIVASDIEEEMLKMLGDSEQIPPMFSALKHNGRRLHEMARKGQEVSRKTRPITVHQFTLLSFQEGRGRFFVHVSKGTYVRSLVDDIGKSLGCGAHLSALRRTQSGRFRIKDAVTLEQLVKKEEKLSITDPVNAISHMTQIHTPVELVPDVANGKKLKWQQLSDEMEPAGIFALVTPGGDALLAIVEIDEETIRYRRVFNYGLTRLAESSTVPAEIV